MTKIVSVVAGNEYSLALSDEGYLFGWGNLSVIGESSLSPIQFGYNKYKMISGGENHIMLIDMDNILYGWGDNNINQLGSFGTIDGNYMNDLIETSELRWKSVSCGKGDTVAITLDGDMYTFGGNDWGQIGNNSTSPIVIPYKIDKVNNSPWIKALCGMNYKIALNEEGRIFVWGYGFYGILGNNTNPQSILVPTEVNAVNGKWIDIITGGFNIFAINDYNMVYGWGYNAFGSLGNGTNNSTSLNFIQNTPILINNLNGAEIQKLNSSYQTGHFMAIYNDNSLYTWGMNSSGQLGKGDLTKKYAPIKINSPVSIMWANAASSMYHSIAVDMDGNVYTCGSNNMGQLGNGTLDINIHSLLEKIVIPNVIIPTPSSTAPPAPIPAPIPTTIPKDIESSNNKKKIIIITVSTISSILVIILLLLLFYKLNLKYKWINRLL